MTYDDAADKPKRDRSAKPWLDMLKEAETADRVYQDKCDSIDKLYADLSSLSGMRQDREFAIFWANLEVLRPTIYSREPVPVVTARFRDRKPLPRKASELLERALVSDFEADDVHETLKAARDDLAVNGRGVVWLRIGDRDGLDVPICEHVDRKDFRHQPARKWKEVGWVARRAWLTREEAKERFGTLPDKLVFAERDIGQDDKAGEKKAEVWELWHRAENVVVWVAPGCDDVLDRREPWMDLTGFFPCPKPAFGTLQRATMIPVPDFVYYRDQVEEINELTARISALAEALRLRGFYPAGAGELSEAIESALKTTDDRAVLVPVSSFAGLGGASFKDSIIWLPVERVAEVIAQLVALRKQVIEDVYQITGLSDIMRGDTAASETLGAQQLKSQYGAIRVRERQEEMVRLARDVVRLKAEIMAEEIDVADLMQMAQIDDLPTKEDLAAQAQQVMQAAQSQAMEMMQQAEAQAMQAAQMAMEGPPQDDAPDPQQAMQQVQAQAQQMMQAAQAQADAIMGEVSVEDVAKMLKDQRTRPFMLGIETDSTIQPDENAEKERRTEYVAAVGGFIVQAAPLVAAAPELGAFVGQTLKFLASGFRAGREMESAIDELVERMTEGQGQGQPDPAAEAQAAAVAAQTERENALAQAEIQLKGAQAQKLMADATRPPSEPVSVDPIDQARLALDERKADQAEAKMHLDAAAKYADLKAAEDRQETADV